MLDREHGWNTSLKPAILGFVFSLLLTLAAYSSVMGQFLSSQNLIFLIFALTGVQAIVQIVFFFHVGMESKPHWYLITFLFTVLITIVIVGGSLWIMYNLNYQMMMPEMNH